MRKIIYRLYLMATPIFVVACNDMVDNDLPNTQSQEVTFSAGSATRSILNGDYTIDWSPFDRIAVFATGGEALKFTSLSEEVTSVATFSGTYVDDDSDLHYSLYPYDENSRANYVDETISFDLPTTQNYSGSLLGSFANGANPAVAIAEGELQGNNLKFKNLCGSLQMQLSGDGCVMSRMDISAVTAGGDTQIIAGEAVVDMSDPSSPEIALDEAGSGVLTLDFGADGYSLTSSVSMITAVLPPVEMGTALNVDITLIDGTKVSTIVVSDDSHTIVKRSSIYVVPTIYNIMSEGSVEGLNLTNIDDISVDKYPAEDIWSISSDAQPTAAQIANVAAAAKAFGKPLSIIFRDVATLSSGSVVASVAKGEQPITIEFPSLTDIEDNAFAAWIDCNVTNMVFGVKSKLTVAAMAFDAVDTTACDVSFDVESNDSYTLPNWMGCKWRSINGGRVYRLTKFTSDGLTEYGDAPTGDTWVVEVGENESYTNLMAAMRNVSDVELHLQFIGKSTMNGVSFQGANNIVSIDISKVEGCVGIPNNFARGLSNLKYVNLPAMITKVGDRAFNECTLLAKVEYDGSSSPQIPAAGGEYKILDCGFYGCKALTSIDVSWATEIKAIAFDQCIKLESIKACSATIFGENVFRSCNSLKSLDLSAVGDFTLNVSTFTGNSSFFANCALTLNADKFNEESTPNASGEGDGQTWATDGGSKPIVWKTLISK